MGRGVTVYTSVGLSVSKVDGPPGRGIGYGLTQLQGVAASNMLGPVAFDGDTQASCAYGHWALPEEAAGAAAAAAGMAATAWGAAGGAAGGAPRGKGAIPCWTPGSPPRVTGCCAGPRGLRLSAARGLLVASATTP